VGKTFERKPPRIGEGITPKLGESYLLYTTKAGEILTVYLLNYIEEKNL